MKSFNRKLDRVLYLVLLLFNLSTAVLSGSSSFFNDPVIEEWLAEMNESPETGYSVENSIFTAAQIKNGTVRGQVAYAGLKKMYRFLGIPYASPPLGPLRFQPPQPYEGWGNGTFQATRHPNSCPQFLTNLTRASEDCLYLSVYTRRNVNENPDGRLLPVIFWIHGGGFAFGQNSYYTGVKLLKEDEVVLVTIQYRLGPIGFFSTGDNIVSASNGMKDMVQAMRWVQENIEAFGGDPNQVTVMGESAGSAAALYMLISPLAQGLFHRVVAISGSPLQEWAIDRNPEQSSKRLGSLLGCSTENSRVLTDCLMEKEWLPITRAGLGIIMEDFKNFKIELHGTTPVIEPPGTPGAFLTDDPLKLLMEGPLPNVPVLLGAVQHEGILPLAAAHYLILEPEGLLNDTDYMRDYFLGDLLRTYGVNERKDGASMSQIMSLAFLPPEADRANLKEYQYELMDAISVIFMKAPILRTVSILSRRLPAVYLYSFEYYSRNSLYHLAFIAIELILGGNKPPIKPGICHADDLMYMFRLPFILTQKDKAFSRSYCKLFTNFVSHGNPTPEPTEEFPIWPKYDDNGKHYLKMAQQFEVKRDYRASWRQGMPNYYIKHLLLNFPTSQLKQLLYK